MTTFRRDELVEVPAGTGSGVARQGRSSRPLLPDTWPLVVLFVAFPLWWVLGLSAVIWSVITAPLLVALIWRQRTKAPAPIMLWFAFTSWVLMSGLQLESGSKITTFTYRLTLYFCGGLLFLYVYNLPRSRRLDVRGAAHTHDLLDDRGHRRLRRHCGRRAHFPGADRVPAAAEREEPAVRAGTCPARLGQCGELSRLSRCRAHPRRSRIPTTGAATSLCSRPWLWRPCRSPGPDCAAG